MLVYDDGNETRHRQSTCRAEPRELRGRPDARGEGRFRGPRSPAAVASGGAQDRGVGRGLRRNRRWRRDTHHAPTVAGGAGGLDRILAGSREQGAESTPKPWLDRNAPARHHSSRYRLASQALPISARPPSACYCSASIVGTKKRTAVVHPRGMEMRLRTWLL